MSYYKDDDARLISVYKRIKLLREGALQPGKKLVDVEIPLAPGQSLKELAARTIHPDQKIVDFTGKPFEKVHLQGSRHEVHGSIIHIARGHSRQHH